MILLALLACAREAALPAPDPARPDVVLLSIDTLRADHLGAWGYERPTSPHLDALAASGTRYASAWAPSPWTLPSHATLLSGRLPRVHGAIEDDLAISPDVPWLPEAMGRGGYATAGFVATFYLSSRFGFARGFDHFHDFGVDDAKKNLKGTVDAEEVFDAALAWARAQEPGRPIFLFLHVYDVHYAYDPPAPWGERFDRAPAPGDPKYRNYAWHLAHPLDAEQLAHQVAQYDEEIAYVDDAFGRFVSRWRAARPAIVSVVADHGEELGERGGWGHGHTLWPEQLHVPWILDGPGVPARVEPGRVGLEDVAPALAETVGVPFPRGGPSARLAETSRFDTLRYRWHHPPHDLVVDLRSGARALCDLAADPGCRVPVDDPALAAALEAELHAELGAPWTTRAPGLLRTDGVLVVGGAPVGPELAAPEGLAFALHPLDARLQLGDAGPFAALGGRPPVDGDPVGLSTRPAGGSVQTTAEERAALEALGYLQEGE